MAYNLEGVPITGRLGQRLAGTYVAPAPTSPFNYTQATGDPAPTAQQLTGGTAPVSLAPTRTMSNPYAPTVATTPPMSNPYPPTVFPTQVTGGTLPPQVAPYQTMSTPTPPQVFPSLLPNQVGPNGTVGPKNPGPLQPLNTASMITGLRPTQAAPAPVYNPSMDPARVAGDIANQVLDQNGAYIQNARLRGIEQASSRGLRNSSIAAGNSERAAIESAMPIINSAIGIQQTREGQAFAGEQNQLDRNQQQTMAQITDWLNNNQFTREYNGQLSLLPITSVAALNARLMEQATDNPEVFPPEIVSGLGEFFSTNLLSMLQSYFPNQYGGGG